MKKDGKISYQEALNTLRMGESVKCQTGSRDDQFEIVHSTKRLEYLYNLSQNKTQMCVLFQIPKTKEQSEENNLTMNFDEAYEMIHSGELVFYKDEDGEEEEITSITELMELHRHFSVRGEELCLYWHE